MWMCFSYFHGKPFLGSKKAKTHRADFMCQSIFKHNCYSTWDIQLWGQHPSWQMELFPWKTALDSRHQHQCSGVKNYFIGFIKRLFTFRKGDSTTMWTEFCHGNFMIQSQLNNHWAMGSSLYYVSKRAGWEGLENG